MLEPVALEFAWTETLDPMGVTTSNWAQLNQILQLIVNTARQQTRQQTGTQQTLHGRWSLVCQQGMWYRGDLQLFQSRLWLRGWEDAAGGDTSGVQSLERRELVSEYLHVLLCELIIYFKQTRGNCWNKNPDHFSEFYFLYTEFKRSVFSNEVMSQFSCLSLVKERNLYSEDLWLYLTVS